MLRRRREIDLMLGGHYKREDENMIFKIRVTYIMVPIW